MLEGVLHLRKGRLLVDELRCLQVRQQPLQLFFGLLHDLLEQAQREFFADHRQGLQQRFLFWREPVDASGEHALHGGGNVKVRW